VFGGTVLGDTEPVIFSASGTSNINTGKAVRGCSRCLLPDEDFEIVSEAMANTIVCLTIHTVSRTEITPHRELKVREKKNQFFQTTGAQHKIPKL
jgi:hypothetical protein